MNTWNKNTRKKWFILAVPYLKRTKLIQFKREKQHIHTNTDTREQESKEVNLKRKIEQKVS